MNTAPVKCKNVYHLEPKSICRHSLFEHMHFFEFHTNTFANIDTTVCINYELFMASGEYRNGMQQQKSPHVLISVPICNDEITRENMHCLHFNIKDISQRVAFSTVRERVRAELHNAADDPDLAEIFDFLISNGVGANEYITSLLDWTAVFVDSTRRQLRFQAFAIVNKMCSEAVWSKMALIKRAYKHVPSNGYCQSPEPAWGCFQWRDLQLLEELLRFFHVSCKKYVDKLSQYDQQKLLGNIDISAADEFLIAKDPRRRHNHQKVKEMLLSATRKHLETLELDKCIVLQQSGFSAFNSKVAELHFFFF